MMLSDFPLWPDQASTVAGPTDTLFIFLCVLTGGVSLLTFLVIFYLAIKYRRTPENELAQDIERLDILEHWRDRHGADSRYSFIQRVHRQLTREHRRQIFPYRE